MASKIFARLATKPFLVGGSAVGAGGLATYSYSSNEDGQYGKTAAEVQFEKSYGFKVAGKEIVKPPSDWKGPLFEIRVDYPKQGIRAESENAQPIIPGPDTPPIVGTDDPWMKYDFEKDPMTYCKVIKEYCWAGNVNNDFVVQKNQVRPWYHAPWMHWSPNGREPLHGLTFERPTPKYELSKTQDRVLQTWACGFYNAAGASAFGRIWKDPNNPAWDKKEFPNGFQFPKGSAVFKILMTDATNEEVPSMVGAPAMKAVIAQPPTPEEEAKSWTWKAYKRNDFASDLRLIQVDFAVRDDRAPIGWVFGTFMYDGTSTKKEPNPWDQIIPVGLMWGNDPELTPEKAKHEKPKESWINPHAEEIRKSLGGTRPSWGWNGRMNGPADNFISACSSCHSISQTGKQAEMVWAPDWTDEQKMHLFRNIKGTEPFGPGIKTGGDAAKDRVSGDYSLQLMMGMANYTKWASDTSLWHRTKMIVPLNTKTRQEDADNEEKRGTLRAPPVYTQAELGGQSSESKPS